MKLMLVLLAFGRVLKTTADADDADLRAWCFAVANDDLHG